MKFIISIILIVFLAGCGTTKGYIAKFVPTEDKAKEDPEHPGYEKIPLVAGEMNRPGTISAEFDDKGEVKKAVWDAKGQSTTEQMGNLMPAYKK
ncbi:unnamed protein product [marine sediment metagenome]|uniref:Uncharacterized protein n=1 Tax=marine sediment metagenome TaxID=412755 RepID=X1GTW1_9ZZZZ